MKSIAFGRGVVVADLTLPASFRFRLTKITGAGLTVRRSLIPLLVSLLSGLAVSLDALLRTEWIWPVIFG